MACVEQVYYFFSDGNIEIILYCFSNRNEQSRPELAEEWEGAGRLLEDNSSSTAVLQREKE